VGVEAYGAYALGAWLAPGAAASARRFARRSALGALGLGMAGQVIYHLLAAAHAHQAPWPVVVLVSCLPVVTLGFGAGLTHLLRTGPAAEASAAALADAPRSAETGTSPAVALDMPVSAPAGTSPAVPIARPRPRAARRTGTAAAVARLRARHPDMSTADIARRLDISDRTVRRHLAAPSAAVPPPAAAA
jgi:hypothetical protein